MTDIGHAPKGAAIVAAVTLTNMVHALDLTVIAEGVETQGQSDEVNAMGCESAQGYFYDRPMPSSAIHARLGALMGTARQEPAVRDAMDDAV